jgi:general L-amino acid transport system permease protein
MDLVATLGGITLNQTGREMESMMLVMLVYLIISLLISSFMNWYNNRVRLVER